MTTVLILIGIIIYIGGLLGGLIADAFLGYRRALRQQRRSWNVRLVGEEERMAEQFARDLDQWIAEIEREQGSEHA